jgi:hypothetical protein
MVLITDHMRRKSHRLPDRHLAAAARNHRLALGAELATRTRDSDGRYHRGPEILAYGNPRPVKGPFGAYYGLTQQIIDELYATCLDDDGRELCTRRARDLLRHRGIVHALSHPMDGHSLSLEGTLAIICEFAFVETLNGGYSAQSARMLSAFIELNNALLAGATLPDSELSPTGRRIVRHILRHGRPIHPWGGSDAHSHNFDRVVTSMVSPEGCRLEDLTAGDLFARMLPLQDQAAVHTGDCPFVALGRAATPFSLVADVAAIILRNTRDNLRRCKNPITWSNIAVSTIFITQDELRRRRGMHRRRVAQLRTDFDPVRLLPLMRGVPSSAWQAPQPRGAPSQVGFRS